MAEIQFGLMMRAQFPRGDDMSQRFAELVEQARLANRLGYASITKGMHYSAAPWQDLQQFPFLSRIMAEAPGFRVSNCTGFSSTMTTVSGTTRYMRPSSMMTTLASGSSLVTLPW